MMALRNVYNESAGTYDLDNVKLCKGCGAMKHVDENGLCGRCQPTPTESSHTNKELEAEYGGNVPMGIGQWQAHGKRFGYWDYSFKQAQQDAVREFAEGLKYQLTHNDQDDPRPVIDAALADWGKNE